MKSLKTLLQEVTAGIKAWTNANFSLGTHVHGNVTNDGKVGTTANLPLITGTGGAVQAGAFGNQANTFCEGNDSRLSDARTPVAHTHTKSDITDLFNSANTWGANQTYSGTLTLSSSSDVAEQFINKLPKDVTISTDALVRFSTLKDSAGHYVITTSEGHWATYVAKSITLKYQNDSTKQGTVEFRLYSDGSGIVYPQSPFECNLGNAQNPWNNLYAKNYYYNGVAWGLDKANVWSQINNFKSLRLYGATSNSFVMYPPSGEKGDSSAFSFNIICSDKNAGGYNASGVANIGMGQIAGTSYVALNASTKGSTDNNIHSIQIGLQIAAADNANIGSFYPTQNGGINLGTSTNKWKTLNGINPGALSIFNPSATQDPIDVPNTWVTNGSAWNTLNVSNMGDGWICLTYRLCGPNDYILARFGGTNANTYPSMIFPTTRLADSGYFVYALMPVAKAMGNIYLEIKLDSNAVLVKHSFIPAYGTV